MAIRVVQPSGGEKATSLEIFCNLGDTNLHSKDQENVTEDLVTVIPERKGCCRATEILR